VADNKKITLAYRESSVPFSYLAGTAPVGFSVDLSNAVVDAVKKQLKMPDLKVELQSVTSQNRIPLLQNGTIDLECGSTTNNSTRGKDVQFAINHFYTGTRLLVKKTSGSRTTPTSPRRRWPAPPAPPMQVMRKYNQEKNLGMDIVPARTTTTPCCWWTRARGGVRDGRHPAVRPDGQLQEPGRMEVVGDSLQVEPYACMLRKDDPKFQALVNGVISGMMKSGEFEKLYTKWFMSPIPPRNQNLNLPMSKELRDNLKAMSDKPAWWL
jgi:ABC-type amino acid transport substrate-binding protein